MNIRKNSIFAIAAGLVSSLIGLAIPFVKMQGADIIGGAGSSTFKLYLMHTLNGLPFWLTVLGGALIVLGAMYLVLAKTVAENCRLKTSALAVGISASCGLGICCALLLMTFAAFGETKKYPIAFPASVLFGFVSFCAFVMLLIFYFKIRAKKWSTKGFVIDVLTALILLPTFLFGAAMFT